MSIIRNEDLRPAIAWEMLRSDQCSALAELYRQQWESLQANQRSYCTEQGSGRALARTSSQHSTSDAPITGTG